MMNATLTRHKFPRGCCFSPLAILAMMLHFFLSADPSSADTYVENTEDFTESVANLFASPHDRAEALSPWFRTDMVWRTFYDREGFTFNPSLPFFYRKDRKCRVYVSLATDLKLDKIEGLKIDLDRLELTLNGFTYEIGGDLGFQGVEDVIEASTIFEDSETARTLVGAFLYTELLGEPYPHYLPKSYTYEGDNDQTTVDVPTKTLLDGLEELFDFTVGGMNRAQTRHALDATADYEILHLNNVAQASLYLENLMTAGGQGRRCSFLYTSGQADNALVSYASTTRARNALGSGATSARYGTDHEFKLFYDLLMFHDAEMLVWDEKESFTSPVERILDSNRRWLPSPVCDLLTEKLGFLDELFGYRGPERIDTVRTAYYIYDRNRVNWRFQSEGKAYFQFPGLWELSAGYEYQYRHQYSVRQDKGSALLLGYGRRYGRDRNVVSFSSGMIVKTAVFKEEYYCKTRGEDYLLDLDRSAWSLLFGQDEIVSTNTQSNRVHRDMKRLAARLHPLLGMHARVFPGRALVRLMNGQKWLKDASVEVSGTVCDSDLTIVAPFLRLRLDNLLPLAPSRFATMEVSVSHTFSDYFPYRRYDRFYASCAWLASSRQTADALMRLNREVDLTRERWGIGKNLENHEVLKFQEKNREDYFRLDLAGREESLSTAVEMKKSGCLTVLEVSALIEDRRVTGMGLDVTFATEKTLVSAASSYGFVDRGSQQYGNDRFDFEFGLERLVEAAAKSLNLGVFVGMHSKTGKGTDQVLMARVATQF